LGGTRDCPDVCGDYVPVLTLQEEYSRVWVDQCWLVPLPAPDGYQGRVGHSEVADDELPHRRPFPHRHFDASILSRVD